MSFKLRFKTCDGYKIPDDVHVICVDCADKKSGTLRPKNLPMRTLCDMCNEIRPDVYTTSSYDWAEYNPAL